MYKFVFKSRFISMYIYIYIYIYTYLNWKKWRLASFGLAKRVTNSAPVRRTLVLSPVAARMPGLMCVAFPGPLGYHKLDGLVHGKSHLEMEWHGWWLGLTGLTLFRESSIFESFDTLVHQRDTSLFTFCVWIPIRFVMMFEGIWRNIPWCADKHNWCTDKHKCKYILKV